MYHNTIYYLKACCREPEQQPISSLIQYALPYGNFTPLQLLFLEKS